jgi:type II secretory pathway component GspD/PulD (secretin)
VEDTTLRTYKILALLSAALAAFLYISPVQAENTTQPDDPQILIEKGLQAFQNHNYEQASILFRQARRIDNEAQKLSKQQRDQLDQLLDESAQGATKYRIAEESMVQGKKAMEAGNFDEAQKHFSRVQDSKNYIPKSWVQEAQVQLGVISKKHGVAATTKPAPAKAQPAPVSEEPAVVLTPAPKAKKSEKVVVTEKKEVVVSHKENVSKAAAVAPAPTCPPMIAKAPGTPANPTLLDEILASRNVQREQVLASFQESERQIRQAVINRQYLVARDRLRQARQDVLRSRMLFKQNELEQLLLQVDGLAKLIDGEEQAFEQQQVLQQVKEAEQKKMDRELQVENEKFDKIQELFAEAIMLRREKRYKDAIEVAKQILEIEPNFDRAKWFIEDLQDMADYTRQQETQDLIESEGRRALTEADASRISWAKEIQYPKDWKELSERRDELIRRSGKMGIGDTPARITEKKLMQTFIDDTKVFTGTLRDAFNVFANKGVRVFVAWDVLEIEGITPDQEVKMEALQGFKDINLKTAMEILLRTLGSADIGIDYAIDTNGVVQVSNKDGLRGANLTPRLGRLETRVYNISDIMSYQPSLSSIPEVEPQQEEESVKQEDLQAKEFDELVSLDELVDLLTQLITTTITPQSWAEAGGEGTVNVWRNNWLIVYQTPEVHDQIASFLDSLREVQSVQIAMEARFITISNNFLEKIGLDLDVIFNQGNAGYDMTGAQNSFGDPNGASTMLLQPRQFSYLGGLPATPTGGGGALPAGYSQPYGAPGLVPVGNGGRNNWTPIPVLNSSNEMTQPQDTALPGNLANSFSKPAFQVAGAFLDDLQVNFLLEATQMDKYSTIVQAPRVVMENGSLGYIAVQTDVPYVESIEVTVGEQAAGQEPTVEYMGFGTVLAVRASTRDLKYVNMYIVPQLTVRAADADLAIEVPIVAPGSVGSSRYTYPGRRTTRVESVVSVPDGGTLLIGGLKQNGEIEIEAGPPVLSKMPVFKRFFSNKATTRDNFTLMVLVKPKIMVREEADPNMIENLKLEKISKSVPGCEYGY